MIKDYFKIDKNPKKGLMTLEWVMLGYMAITIITMLFTYTKLVNPEAMLWGRLKCSSWPSLFGQYTAWYLAASPRWCASSPRWLCLPGGIPTPTKSTACSPTSTISLQVGSRIFRMSARPALCQSPALGCSKRTDVDGLLYVLSDDCIGFILLFLL